MKKKRDSGKNFRNKSPDDGVTVYQLTRAMSLILVHDMYDGSTLTELIRQSRGKLHYFRLIDRLAYFQRL